MRGDEPRRPAGLLATACAFSLALTGAPRCPAHDDHGVTLVRGPYLQSLLEDSVLVRWATVGSDLPGRVRVGVDGGPSRIVDARPGCETLAEGETCHEAVLSDLLPDTRYRYEILDGDATAGEPDQQLSFKTPPRAGEGVIRMAVFGDSGIAREPQFAVADIVRAFEPEAILHTGDLDYLMDPDRSVFGPYADLLPRACLFAARGNHDHDIPFEGLFTLPGVPPGSTGTYGSFDWGPARFIFLDTTLGMEVPPPPCREGAGQPGQEDLPDCSEVRPTPGEAELNWLCGELDAARRSGQAWTIVVMHDPMFTLGAQAPGSEELRHLLAPLFEAHGVDLVLAGDDHNYQASEAVTMRSARTCGDLAPLDCEKRDEEGNIIDARSCYEVIRMRSAPNYSFPEGAPRGPIYVVSGGGGQLLYPRAVAAAAGPFSRVFRSEWHAVELKVSAATLAVRAVSIRGERLDSFTISKLRFLRGDMNFDRLHDLADAVAMLAGLFLGAPVPCLPAGDVDGDGFVLIGDPIALLRFMFLGATPPVAPFPACGPIPEGSPLFCERNGC